MSHVIINKKCDCCGCKNCQNICPQNAIEMREDEEGFLYPYVNEDRCIKCGLCKKVCPWINDIKRIDYLDKPISIASKIKDKSVQLNSSSGGIFGALALNVLENGGYVVGCEMDKNNNIHHVLIDKKEDLYKIMGSKYVYSDLDDIFKKIKQLLIDKKEVLFCGVPCQVAALLTFLQKPFKNLYTVEVICHGTPSQKLFEKYVAYLEKKYKAKLKKYYFRSKKAAHWGTFKAYAIFTKSEKNREKEIGRVINADFDPYYWSFLNCMNYRESCYNCKFANSDRIADLTLGDFWGIEKIKPSFIDYNGVSIVIINSFKGKELFKKINKSIFECEVKYDLVQRYNGQLKHPSIRPIERNTWYNNFESDDFIDNIKIKNNIKSYIKVLFPQKMKFCMKKIMVKDNKRGDSK